MRKENSPHLFDVEFFKVIIFKAKKTTTLLKTNDTQKRMAILTLSGDASVTAHYRYSTLECLKRDIRREE
jgi:hypothetical protein